MEMLASLDAAATKQPHSATADYALGLFHEAMPEVTRDQIRDTAARVPVSSKMLDAVKLAVDKHNATVVIASDANDFFIRSMLQRNNMTEYVTEIHANKAKWDSAKSARLRVKPYHAKSKKPHGCELCPSNLCKGNTVAESTSMTLGASLDLS
jgi:2,3-diketo-5-methylthio-1-phosphopentane phosphatase